MYDIYIYMCVCVILEGHGHGTVHEYISTSIQKNVYATIMNAHVVCIHVFFCVCRQAYHTLYIRQCTWHIYTADAGCLYIILCELRQDVA